jgi:hydroxyacylglutathione hydrolase
VENAKLKPLEKLEDEMALKVLRLVTGDLQENCYLLWQEGSLEAIVFDPGDEAPRINSELKVKSLKVAAFLQTHCHGDHIGALTPLKKIYPDAPLYVHEAEADWLQRPTLNLSYFYGVSITGPKPDHLVRHDDKIDVAGLSFRAIHVPGHSPGSTAYYVEQPGGPPHLFGGDVLFQGSIGRTDLPGGEGEEVLVEGIREKLFVLPDETIVHPGHGPDTTIGDEKENNPFCGLG